MKKFIFSAIAALFAFTAASAQDAGRWAVGPRMNIYTNAGDGIVGLGGFARYSFTDKTGASSPHSWPCSTTDARST